MRRTLIIAAGLLALAAGASAAATHRRDCGLVSWHVVPAKGQPYSGQDRVYVAGSQISCARARSIDLRTDEGTGVPGWRCHFNKAATLTTCVRGAQTVSGELYQPPGPGSCKDVQGYFGEYATTITASAVGCYQARVLVAQDMSTPACVSDCLISAWPAANQFECTPQGEPYGPYQDEQCIFSPSLVTFSIVNGP
jgi:hypothetical protein